VRRLEVPAEENEGFRRYGPAAAPHQRRRAVDANTTLSVIEPGTLLYIAEADYLYGSGDVRVRVDKRIVVHRAEDWVTVHGTRVWTTGQEVEQVSILVRVAALAGAVV
jgi:hypothetical protein